MQLVPYLNFDGNCAEAFEFYATVFGGRIVHRQTFGEMPPMEGMPPMTAECKRRIMHMHLLIKEQSLMASDTMPGMDPACAGGYQVPSGLWVAIQADDMAEGTRLFSALGQGADIVMPFTATEWSQGFGMLRDRFGTPWMINVQPAG